MTITIRDYTTGESIKSWNQPGSRAQVRAVADGYAIGTHLVIEDGGAIEVWVVQ